MPLAMNIKANVTKMKTVTQTEKMDRAYWAHSPARAPTVTPALSSARLPACSPSCPLACPALPLPSPPPPDRSSSAFANHALAIC